MTWPAQKNNTITKTISQSRKINIRKTWPKIVVLCSEIACCKIYEIQCWDLITNIQSKANNVLSCQTRSTAAVGVCVGPLLHVFPPLSVLHSWGDAVFAQTLIHAEGFISRWQNRGMEEEKWRDVISRGWMCRSCHGQQTIKACSPAASSQQTCQTRPDHSCWLEWAPHESLTETTAAGFLFFVTDTFYIRDIVHIIWIWVYLF